MQAGKKDPKEFGQEGESLAAHFLEGLGYRILERNYRCQLGEIDLILEKTPRKRPFQRAKIGKKSEDRHLTFAEVKTRHSVEAVSPRELVGRTKQLHISRTAQHYLTSKKIIDFSADFGVIIVDFSKSEPQFEWIENAFTLAWGY